MRLAEAKFHTRAEKFYWTITVFRRFIRGFASISAPLKNLTRKNSGIKPWDSKGEKAFAELKESLVQTPIIQAPNWSQPF